MKIVRIRGFSFLLLASLTACSFPALQITQEVPDATGLHETIAADFTSTTAASSQPDPLRTAFRVGTSPVPQFTMTPVFTLAVASFTPTQRICDRAGAGQPVDITMPDDSLVQAGQAFTKTWRLVNLGSCSWTAQYAVQYFSGTAMGSSIAQPFSAVILPDQTVDISLDLLAPQEAGTFQSNFKLRSPAGALFGIGPNGDAPIWVRIIVIATETATPPPPPTPTISPVIVISGKIDLLLGDNLDLDTGVINPNTGQDLSFRKNAEGNPELAPINTARLGMFGKTIPSIADCRTASLTEASVPLISLETGDTLCYRTSQGLLGTARLLAVPAGKKAINIYFETWAVP